jgi:hypothetical protein
MEMATMNALMQNHRIISHNSRVRSPMAYSPLHKSVSVTIYSIFWRCANRKMFKVHGDGRAIAQLLQTQGTVMPLQAAIVPAVGVVRNNFNGNPSSYTHQEILNMVIFYNEDFNILPGDDVATRRNKFREWISTI